MNVLLKHRLLLILFIAVILRLISLNQSFWLDEAIGAIAVHDYSYIGIITEFIKGDTHPPLYYLTLKFWTDIFGYSEIAMRTLSVMFGVMTVYVVYQIGKLIHLKIDPKLEIKNWNFPEVATFFIATSGLHIYYSQEVRMYAMNTLLVTLLVLFYLRADFKKYAVTLLILGMTDYLPLLILPALWLFASIEKKDRKWWSKFIICHVPLAIFLIFWFPTFLIQSAGSREALQLFSGWGDLIGKASIKELALVWVKFLIGRISFESKLLYGFIVLLLTILVSYPFIKSAIAWKRIKLFWLWLTIPVALTFVGALVVPGFSYFRMIIVLPAFYLLLAFGLEKIGSRTLTAIVLLANIYLSLMYLFNPVHHREEWRESVVYIESRAESTDIVLQAFPEPFAGYRWYSRNNAIPTYGATKKLGATNEEIKENTKNVIDDKAGIYYFEYLDKQTDPTGIIRLTILDSGFSEVEVTDFRGVGFVRYYQRE